MTPFDHFVASWAAWFEDGNRPASLPLAEVPLRHSDSSADKTAISLYAGFSNSELEDDMDQAATGTFTLFLETSLAEVTADEHRAILADLWTVWQSLNPRSQHKPGPLTNIYLQDWQATDTDQVSFNETRQLTQLTADVVFSIGSLSVAP